MNAQAFLASILFSACQMMSFVLYPYFSEVTGLAPGFIVASFSFGSFLFLWGAPFWARQAQTKGWSRALAFGLGGLLLSQVLLLMMLKLPKASGAILIVSRILYGLTASAIIPLAQMMLTSSSPTPSRMKAMTRHSLSLHVGRLIGPLLVWLGLLWGTAAPLWISVGLLGLLLLFVMLAADRDAALLLPQSTSSARAWGSRFLLALALVTTALVGVIQASLTQHIRQEFQLSTQQAAQLTLRFLLLASLVTVGVQSLMQGTLRNPWQGTMPVGALLLTLSSALLYRAASTSELWYALPLFAAGLAFLTPSYTAALSLQSGNAAAQLAVIHTLGYALGGLAAAGMLAIHASPLGLTVLLSILLVPLAFVVKAEGRSLAIPERDLS